MKNIASSFIKAKRAFGPVLKVSTNPHFKSKFAPLETCLEAVDEACLANGIALYQETSLDDSGITIETVFLHESGESLRCGKLHVPASKNDPQGFGSALTYARRYSLLAACGIAAEDDDGNSASKTKKTVHVPTGEPLVSIARMSVIADVAEAIKERFEVDDLLGAYSEYEGITDGEEKTALWKLLPSNVRSAIKKKGQEIVFETLTTN
jgi:hypothetical protein